MPCPQALPTYTPTRYHACMQALDAVPSAVPPVPAACFRKEEGKPLRGA
jgi:hypothetical protein